MGGAGGKRPNGWAARRPANKNAAGDGPSAAFVFGVRKIYFFLPFLAAVFLPAALVVVFFLAAIFNLPSYWDERSFCFDS